MARTPKTDPIPIATTPAPPTTNAAVRCPPRFDAVASASGEAAPGGGTEVWALGGGDEEMDTEGGGLAGASARFFSGGSVTETDAPRSGTTIVCDHASYPGAA